MGRYTRNVASPVAGTLLPLRLSNHMKDVGELADYRVNSRESSTVEQERGKKYRNEAKCKRTPEGRHE